MPAALPRNENERAIEQGGRIMPRHFARLGIVVRDLEQAKAFFAVLGFKEAMSVIIAGEPFATYMGVCVSRRIT
ncbi:hypothetical protein JYK14_08840 [Siccirubricoccus sp. KC 17139]|uniref:Glyoxalase/fosfomycin resistance/dioxygenase domain-containing protein n=1 Tax=Siccirubricoccus soli TaxID=2899147 RepID=A0ABT1D2W6_9PROT|nr:hypothetical protein [Siccirubricoccus soli]MCO6416273.1 hypothetical protein [Siccirubricoccus soli]MCP2682407.1 hypothetical protein [Siccirubricoccus soli]